METVAGAVSNSIIGLGVPVAYPSIATYPYNCVVLIETSNPAGHAYLGSGVIIGPHTILTASHLLWDSKYQSEANQVWLYPGYYQYGIPNPPGSFGPLSANFVWHNNIVGDAGKNTISPQSSQDDFAVIDTDYTFPSWINVLLNYGGGSVHVTGYPATANGVQVDNVGNVTKDPGYSLLDYPIGFVSPGNSGGPLWNYFGGSPYVVGIVSTAGWGVQLTNADWNTILAWENADSYLWPSPSPPPPPPPPPLSPAAVLAASGEFNGNANPDFVWRRASDSQLSMWEYDPAAQTVSTTSLGTIDFSWAVVGSAHYSDAGATQMLMDYVPTGTMTLWWVGGGTLTGVPIGSSQNQNWANISYITSGQFSNGGGPGIADFLVSNNTDHHLYDWWIAGNGTLQGIDLGAYWSNVAAVGAGQFTGNGGTNLLVTNTTDYHLYDWWIDSNGTLQGFDLGAYWSNVALVTVGRFDNKTTNTEMLVQNTLDHHLYEWWISPQGQLTGIDLGAYWNNIQLVGNSHYNNGSAFNELLVRNTSDGHFYEWWIAGTQLVGVDLGAVAPGGDGSAGSTVAAGALAAAGGAANATAAGVSAPAAGAMAIAGSTAVSSGSDATVPATSPASTSLLVQAMAAFGASDAAVNPTGAMLSDGAGQLSEVVTSNDQHLTRG